MSHLVRLRESARPVRRGRGQVQFGLSPGHGIVLADLTDPEVELLLGLGESGGTARPQALATRFGVPADRVSDLVATLRASDLLVDPARRRPDPGRRTVCVPGAGNVVELVREGLDRHGVRQVQQGATGVAGGADLAVLVAREALAVEHGRPWQSAGTPQLPVVLREDGVTLGPVVYPGSTPCLRCLDLHRSDRDRAWPTILTQLASTPNGRGATVHCPDPVATVVAGLVGLVVLTVLEELPSPADGTVPGLSWQVALPWPDVRTRVWTVHPRCDCAVVTAGHPPGAVVTPDSGPGSRSGPGSL